MNYTNTQLTTSPVWDGDLEPLRPEDSISCVGAGGFKSRRRDSPLFDGRYGRNRVKAQPPPPLKVIDPWAKSPSSHQRAGALPRSKPKTTTTTTTTHTVQYREPARYVETTLPLRPAHSRKHSSSKQATIVDRESSYASSSSKKSSSKAAPPRSNDRFYEYRREEPATSRGRAVGGSFDAGHRTTCVAPRAYSQDRGSGRGVYNAFGSSRGTSWDRGRRDGLEQLDSRDDLRYGSRRLSNVGSMYGESKGEHRGYGHSRRK